MKKSAFTQLSTFSDLSLDDIIRACPGLQLLDSPVATFAPLRDGRAPMASYPRTLRHFRLASTLTEGGEDSDSDDEYGSSSDSGMPTTFKVLEELPSDLKSLKLERSRAFDGSDRSADFPLRSLQSLEVTFTSAFKENIEWVLAPSVHSGTLTDLKLW